ncbi:MAG: GntR family transcriptional regulator [Acetobacteraceae bacterium]
MNRRVTLAHADGALTAAGGPAQRPRGAADHTVYRALVEAITDHRLPPGTPLPEDRLASAFGYSRSVIRQALQLAAHDRLVEQRPNHTAFVARPAFQEARDVFAARRMVEVPLVAVAAERADHAHLAALEDNLADERLAIAAGQRHSQLHLSGEFHRLIAALAGNPVIARFVGQLVSQSALILALYESVGQPSCSAAEHAALLAAIADHDPAAAESRMAAHLERLAANLAPAPEPRAIDFRTLFATKPAEISAPRPRAHRRRTALTGATNDRQ